MRSADLLVSYRMASHVAEVSGTFQMTVSRAPADGEANEATVGKVRGLRVHLEYETEGRGDTDSHQYPSVSIPVDRFGAGKADIMLEVPFDAPISYDGDLLRVKYQIVVVSDRQRAFDDAVKIPVIVAPAGGANTYERPHPLSGW